MIKAPIRKRTKCKIKLIRYLLSKSQFNYHQESNFEIEIFISVIDCGMVSLFERIAVYNIIYQRKKI